MKREDLDRAFGATPAVFTAHIDDALRAFEEEKPMKKFTYRTALVAAMLTLMLCGIAYAVIYQGQPWYYDNRFTALKENEPETYRAIMDNLTTDVPQDVSPDAAGLVSAVVQDYAWAAEKGVFTVSMAARPEDDKKFEIYPLWNLDPDGACADALDPDDPEIRTEHWLMTKNGFGLPEDVMNDPTKRLLLVDFESDLLIGDTDVTLPGESYDAFVGEDGAAIFVYKYDLSLADPEAIKARYAEAQPAETDAAAYETRREGDKGAEVLRIQQRLSDLGYYNGYLNGEYDGEVTLCLTVFQKKNGLTADGVAGPDTQRKLFAADAAPVTADWETPAAPSEPLREETDQMIADAQSVRDALAKSTAADGTLTLRAKYRVYPFVNGEIGEPTEGSATFTVKTK